MNREFDLIVFGATGFTGGMTAAYLARHAPAALRWAIAGRSREKLDAVKARLIAIAPHCARVELVQASVDDRSSLDAMAARTHVLLTTVGPFIDYGEPVASACVAQGADYIDSTGEPNFVALLLARFGDEAARRKLRIVPCCGFDSIPSDLGALYTVSQLPEGQPIRLAGYLSLDAAFSGGTERSAIRSLAPAPSGLALPPPRAEHGRRVSAANARVERRRELGGWTAPLPTIDAAIVLRSAASLERYGPEFSYAHHVVHRSFALLVAATLLFGSLALIARFAPLQALFLKFAKRSGEGPSEAKMQTSWFKLRFVAECAGKQLETEVSGGDPGYVETSKMLAESALCLALDRERLPERFGVLTTAEAMGEILLERLQRAGLRFVTL